MQMIYYLIVDVDGNVVLVMMMINGLFGFVVVVEGVGFLLNNEMDDFVVVFGKLNQFGLVEGENNVIVFGKCMFLLMMLSIVFDLLGEFFFVVGMLGGLMIIISVFYVVFNVLDYGMIFVEVIESFCVYYQVLFDLIFVENVGFSDEMFDGLCVMGYEI